MASHDWSRFVLRIPIATDRQSIFNRWISQLGLESWFLRKAEFKKPDGSLRKANDTIEVNDSYEWMWHGYPDEVSEKGKILQLNKNLLKFSFGKAGNVTVTINEDQGQQLLELVQDEIPTDENSKINYYLGCSKGWVYHLTTLKSILEGGLNLTNRDEKLKEVLNS